MWPRLLEQSPDVILIDLDSNPDYAIKLVESICATDSAAVMVYSEKAHRDMVVRCMRAGAREYLTLPLEQNTMHEALGRVFPVRSSITMSFIEEQTGKIIVLFGAKGGSGVAAGCLQSRGCPGAGVGPEHHLLNDLGLPMGDAALNLGIVAEYSTDNALLDSGRLDASFLTKLLVKHRSGLSVLAAPGKVTKVQASHDGIDKLLTIARKNFENVVVDFG